MRGSAFRLSNYVETRLRRYVQSLGGHKTNVFPGLSAPERARIAQEWRRCFDEWGYATS